MSSVGNIAPLLYTARAQNAIDATNGDLVRCAEGVWTEALRTVTAINGKVERIGDLSGPASLTTSAFGQKLYPAVLRSVAARTFDALAHTKGCPKNKTGGVARKWLEEKGLLAKDEAELTKAFMVFARRAGSHAGISDQVDAQLRRHFATALMSFAIAKLG